MKLEQGKLYQANREFGLTNRMIAEDAVVMCVQEATPFHYDGLLLTEFGTSGYHYESSINGNQTASSEMDLPLLLRKAGEPKQS